MSGGSLDYFYNRLEEHIGDFNDKELDDLVKDLAKLFHDREWYLSCDYGEDQWNEARDKFKQKWFSEGARGERIEQYLEEVKQELLHSFGVSKKREEHERQSGRWIHHKADGCFLPQMECSVCGASDILEGITPQRFREFYLYCWNCGAKMS